MTGAIGPEIRHILCGVDRSAPACRAADKAAWLAVALKADLTYLPVARNAASKAALDAWRKGEGLRQEPLQLVAAEAESCLQAAQDRAAALRHIAAARLIQTRSVGQTLLSVAQEVGADTIVLGRHSHGALRRAIMG